MEAMKKLSKKMLKSNKNLCVSGNNTKCSTQGHATVCYGEYLFGRPKSLRFSELIAVKARDFFGQASLSSYCFWRDKYVVQSAK